MPSLPACLPMQKCELAIGAVGPLSGSASVLGREMVNAIQMAADCFAAAPDRMGVSVKVMDDRGSEPAGLECARALIEDDSILAVIGHYNSSVTLKALPVYADAGLALVAPIVSNPA